MARTGRPRKNPEGARTVAVSFRVTEEEYRRLQGESFKLGLSITEIARARVLGVAEHPKQSNRSNAAKNAVPSP
jgi:hypothetical protein